ncbi:toxin VasX [Xenorhabdus miraniensis]|uniref:Toxin VasX N-terminal region domain-containing protein n=1 Tax=Xenorhabdus miraniensis TaxID=351674 RepID=A0A2D0JWU0_9GAMM|nr:toxin VasX [Xenorhabdus miraniensis]PHM50796.1 hypothetical protein Xmir_00200 [Xenorhabdus miraniensis]
MTSSITDISENANKSVSRLDMGNAKYPCDGNIKPIYPVRYAYVNFFGKELEKPEAPPDIHTLMSATTLKESKGYAARLMRPGWIYIREEDSMEHRPSKTAYFHIFKYEQNGKQQTENFRKFIYRNMKDARDGIVPEPGLNGEGYPFLFVAKDVSNISIAYSEHLWHPDVIARINGDLELRKKTMQFINLDDDNQPHAIEANEANFTQLIQDYKTRKEQFTAAKAKIDAKNFGDLDLATLRIDELTTQLSYEMDADNIALEIRKKLCYQEKSRIVILHDPVGRQKEILEAHNILDMIQQYNAEQDLYPMTIGLYMESLAESYRSQPLNKRAFGSVRNKDAIKKYWRSMKAQHLEFEKRQDNFISLFKAFASASGVTGQTGSLDHYFRYFFSVHKYTKKDILEENDIQEIHIFVDLIYDIFNGLQMSITSEKMLEELISLAAENSDISIASPDAVTTLSDGLSDPNKQSHAKNNAITSAADKVSPQYSTNAWEIAATGMVKILTHGESGEIASKLGTDTKKLYGNTKDYINDPEKSVQKSKNWLNEKSIKIHITIQYVSEKFFQMFGRILGKALAIMETGALKIKGPLTHLSDAAIRLIANKIIPALLEPFGTVIDYRSGPHITADDFAYIKTRLGKITNKKHYSGNKKARMPKHHEIFRKLHHSQSLFYKKLQETAVPSKAEQQLEHAVRKAGDSSIKAGHVVSDQVKMASTQASIGIKLAKITIKEGFNTSFDFFKVGTHKTAILLQKTAPGFSLFLNVKTATSVVIQSQFSQNNPLDQDELSKSYDIVKFTTALISATADLTLITSKVTKHAPKFIPNASPTLLNKSIEASKYLENKLKQTWVKSGLGLVNIFGAYVSFIDGRKAASISNKGAAYSNYAIGLGSAALGTVSVISASSAVGAAVTVATGVELAALGAALITGLTVVGWLLVIGGTIGLILNNQSDMQNLVRNCFWGNGDMYPFWGTSKRPALFSDQLKIARKMSDETKAAFNIESQEFINLFFMPSLAIKPKQEYKRFSTDYIFTLPAFQAGSADLQYAFYKPLPKEPANTWAAGRWAPVDSIERHMESSRKEKECYKGLKYRAEEIDGRLYIYDEEFTEKFREALKTAQAEYKNGNLELTINIEDKASYPYKETTEIFWHYIPYEDTIVPLRYLTNKEMNKKPIIGFKGEELR